MGAFIHQDRPWLKQVLKAATIEHSLYSYGCESIEVEAERFFRENRHRYDPYHVRYEPNPFHWQYDLEMHIFLNYEALRNREIKRLTTQLKNKWNQPDEDRLKFVKEFGPTGIPRHEHIFNAAEIRWPTIEFPGSKNHPGRLEGSFVRDPWAARRMEGISSGYNYVAAFGGGGQGKTWTFIGFGLMLFEHFLYTRNGAKCSVSTVNEDKIKGVQWPDMIKLHNDTQNADYSLYSGRSVIAGDWTIKRPNTKDTAGVFRAILVGRNISDQSVIDKLTGTHGHSAYFYLVDEAQSTPRAPIEASGNYMSTGTPTWVTLTGNYGEEGDTLDQNIKPLRGGWDAVNPETQQWISQTMTGNKCWVMHFNNNLSPAYLDRDWQKRCPYLPNKDKLKRIYPSPSMRNPDNMAYRRFWIGWKSNDIESDRVLTNRLVEAGLADRKLELSLDYPIHTSASFDSAECMGDRNVLGILKDGMDEYTEEWIWGIAEIHNIEGVSNPRMHQEVVCTNCVKVLRRAGVKSGDIIIDGTKNTGHAGVFHRKGIHVISMVYHKNLPDGRTVDKHSRVKHPAILVNPNTNEFAHQIAFNHISFGAWLLNQYVSMGKVRGINDDLLTPFPDRDRTLEEELYRRKLESKVTKDYGDRLNLDCKEEFKKKFKFSPDIFDMLCQAAFYMFTKRGIPLFDSARDEQIKTAYQKAVETDEQPEEMMQAQANIWVERDDYEYLDLV